MSAASESIGSPPPTTRPSRLGNTIVALVYLALAVAVHGAILRQPRTLLAMPAEMLHGRLGGLYQADQRFVAATIASNARKLAGDPCALSGFGSCYPMRASYTLGEHMLGEGLLAVPAWLLTGDPILTYNVVIVLSVWIAALAMYALALHFTGSVPAAFVAGLLFAGNAGRLSNPAHPFVHGNLWTPLALLFASRLLARQRWRDAAGLALFLVLQLLESLYQVLALAILGSAYGLYLLVLHRRTLRALLPKLIAVAALTGGAAWLVFAPYLETRATWDVLQGRKGSLLLHWREYLPGGAGTPGLVALVLALLGLVDRLRQRRPVDGHDPRLALLGAGLLVLWGTLMPFRVPLLHAVVPNPLVLLASVAPGLDAVRVLNSMRFGFFLVVSFLGAYGVVMVTERLRAPRRVLAAAALGALTLLEAYEPTKTLTPRSAALASYPSAPSESVLELVSDLPEGAVLDLPSVRNLMSKLTTVPNQILLAAYHQRPVAACYNSFPSPFEGEVKKLAARLPEPAAADALYALGFRTILLHEQQMTSRQVAELAPLLDDARRLTHVGSTDGLRRYSLSSPVPVTDAVQALAYDPAADPSLPRTQVTAPETAVEFLFTNRSAATFRHPTFAPLPLRAHWYDQAGELRATSPVRGMLPLAVPRAEQVVRSLRVAVPVDLASGSYRLEITSDVAPGVVLARRDVILH